MKIWLVKRLDVINYDEYDGFVCNAETEEIARNMNPNYAVSSWPVDISLLEVTFLGYANDGTERGTILASYKAG